jgi:hypothetical protein
MSESTWDRLWFSLSLIADLLITTRLRGWRREVNRHSNATAPIWFWRLSRRTRCIIFFIFIKEAVRSSGSRAQSNLD